MLIRFADIAGARRASDPDRQVTIIGRFTDEDQTAWTGWQEAMPAVMTSFLFETMKQVGIDLCGGCKSRVL